MAELRWHPVLGEWVITASHRQDRTYKPPTEYCPLCPTRPGSLLTEIPEPTFQIAVFENKFPALHPAPQAPNVAPTELYPVREATGVCEVVVYSPDHQGSLTTVGEATVRNLVDVWADRFQELGAQEEIQYVFPFENRGEAVGVTLHHPHGQIYAFPYIPPIPARELAQAAAHQERTGRCLFCDIVAEERRDGRRIVAEDELFVAFIPFFARYPYEVHVLPKRHVTCLLELDDAERWSLARTLRDVITQYDRLFGFPMPYMMVLHQRPTDGSSYPYYHFHVEFYPLSRTAGKLKYLAGCESGAGSFVTDMSAEDQAQRLAGSKGV